MSQEKERKIRIGVMFGGKSGEHEVSLASARFVMDSLNKQKYEVIPIGITRSGSWLLGREPQSLLEAGVLGMEAAEQKSTAVALTGDPTLRRLIPVGQNVTLEQNGALDVIFPVLHGTNGEDGTLQGLLEMANLPYVGCGVLGSALGMDKEKMKMLFQTVGLPQANFYALRRRQWERDPEPILDAIEKKLGYPNFVKPANLGSSVGINKAHDRQELEQAITVAAEFDTKVIVEQNINCRELECAVLGNDEPIASVIGEIIASNEFYDYDAKYVNNKSETVIPANIPPETAQQIRQYALQAFEVLDLQGLARVDFFIEKTTGEIYINEVNTMPGFTQISMYTKLWVASGLPASALMDRLIELAIERYEDRQRNRTSR